MIWQLHSCRHQAPGGASAGLPPVQLRQNTVYAVTDLPSRVSEECLFNFIFAEPDLPVQHLSLVEVGGLENVRGDVAHHQRINYLDN